MLEEVKTKQNSKGVIGRKSFSIKKLSKENNSDYSISQLTDKFGQKLLKNNNNGNTLISNISNSKKITNKTIPEDNKYRNNNNNKIRYIYVKRKF